LPQITKKILYSILSNPAIVVIFSHTRVPDANKS
jgi:hypothetical protein